jgi:hypothetical protein
MSPTRQLRVTATGVSHLVESLRPVRLEQLLRAVHGRGVRSLRGGLNPDLDDIEWLPLE